MISIIIPTYNEEASIAKLISYLKSVSKKEEIEIIISDGGSTDNTIDSAKINGVKAFNSPKKGRAAQMNYGAELANGEIFYFLHADSYPPKTFVKDIKNGILNGKKAGCYRLTFDDGHLILKVYGWLTRFNIDYFRFGDQSLFIEKKFFKKLHGFDEELIVMEDQVFVRKIKKETDFLILKGEVKTSARKYRQVGIIKLQLIFSVILILFYLGASQAMLVKFYKRSIG